MVIAQDLFTGCGSGLRQVVEHPAEADCVHAVARTTLFDRDPEQISSRLTPAWLILEIGDAISSCSE
jgi:hypothetical protein